jgi:release factor glutamine methyltransferase
MALSKGPEKNSMKQPVTAHTALADAGQALAQWGIASALLDARLLLAHALGMERTESVLLADRPLKEDEISRFSSFVARRAHFEPVAYITGKKEFWSLDFCVTRDTLIPRPDSETLIEAALKRVRIKKTQEQAGPIALLDIGTGTGCLLIALLKELPAARGVGLDNSERALQVAEENAKRHGVETRARFIRSHWCDALHGTFDLILSNPPYIAEGAMNALMPDVLHFEPRSALAAGADGMDAYRALAPQVAARLNPGGVALFEVGQGQAKGVSALLSRQGLMTEYPEKDLAGTPRCVVARKQDNR